MAKETASLKGGLTFGTTISPYKDDPQQTPEGKRARTGGTTSVGKAAGLFGGDYKHRAKDILSARFLIPPFSVLNTREGFWQERKRQWIALGIRSELGRGFDVGANKMAKDAMSGNVVERHIERKAHKKHMMMGAGGTNLLKQLGRKNASPGGSPKPAMDYSKGQRGRGDGKPLEDEDSLDGGTSVFDPVLCELAYRWFSPPGASVLDPFAGGSVRGIVAGELGREYFGIDLSLRQLTANAEQAQLIGTQPAPIWCHGDSVDVRSLAPRKFDLLFSCPPYGDLERYSDDPADLSTLPGDEFDEKYGQIICEACECLKANSFAVFVVGDYRDKDGFYRNLPGLTIDAFRAGGLNLYNTMILVNATGSLPLRINKQFNGSRKVGTTHQIVLVFAKGQPKDFVRKWPTLEVE